MTNKKKSLNHIFKKNLPQEKNKTVWFILLLKYSVVSSKSRKALRLSTAKKMDYNKELTTTKCLQPKKYSKEAEPKFGCSLELRVEISKLKQMKEMLLLQKNETRSPFVYNFSKRYIFVI